MWIKRSELTALSEQVRQAIDGQPVELWDDREGPLSLLKNDLNALVRLKQEQLDASRQERDRLAAYLADISHQLKTPITSLRLMAELLPEAPPEKQAEFCADIQQGLARMEWLTAALLKLARLDAGAVHFTPVQTSTAELLRAARAPLEILLELKDQRVELLRDTALVCDRRWTAEALTNLLKNALEYSPAGSRILVDSGQNPIYRWFSVTDGGAGIPRAELGGLFQRFRGSRSEGGTGIGLPLALSIVRGQNGDIVVDGGGNGSGATFTAKLYR